MSLSSFERPAKPELPRLSVLVPYRDRAVHLQQFIPHMREFLSKDSRIGPAVIHVIEQHGEAPFNRGKLLNCGFDLIGNKADYLVFHDVDYLPEVADYSFVDRPTRLIWHGLVLKEDYDNFFGAVCGVPAAAFRAVNGFSNKFWHWGCEDIDLRLRFQSAGFGIDYRDGVFRSLSHAHNGFDSTGQLRAEVLPNFQRLQDRWATQGNRQPVSDGLDSLVYRVVSSQELLSQKDSEICVYLHSVDIGQPDSTKGL